MTAGADRRQRALALGARAAPLLLLAFFGAWGGWAIAVDQHPEYSESVYPETIRLQRCLEASDCTLLEHVRYSGYRPPLSYLAAGLIAYFTQPSLLLCRLTILLQYLLCLALVYSSGRIVARGDRGGGLLAMVVVGAMPAFTGWGRMCYMEMALCLGVMLSLRLLLTCDLNRPLDGIKLGLAVGLAALTKLAFGLFAVGPLLWTLLFRVRRPRQLGVLGLCLLTAGVVCGWWFVMQWEEVLLNLQMSSPAAGEGGAPRGAVMLDNLRVLVLEVDGALWTLALALAASLAAWRLRAVDRATLALLSLAVWPALLLLLGFFAQIRYALPVYMTGGLLAGAATHAVLTRLDRRLGALGSAALGLALLGYFVALHFGLPVYKPDPREDPYMGARMLGPGLLTPDRGPNDTFWRTLKDAEARFQHPRRCLLVYTGFLAYEKHYATKMVTPQPYPLMVTHKPGDRCVILISDSAEASPWQGVVRELNLYQMCLNHAWLQKLRDRTPLSTRGPSVVGLRYTLYRLGDARLPPAPDESPGCKMERWAWEEKLKTMRDEPVAEEADQI